MPTSSLRALSTLAACLALPASAAKDFWETKDPATWTNQEKQLLLSQSPWAIDGSATMDSKRKQPDVPCCPNDLPSMKPGPNAQPQWTAQIGKEVPRAPNPDPGPPVQFRVLARWETAKPIRDAGAPEIPDLSGDFYVIRLIGLPLMPPPKVKPGQTAPNPNEGMLQSIKQGTYLSRKGKPPIPCARLFTGSGEHLNEVLLFFPRSSANPITLADKQVVLESWFNPFYLSIRFPLKQMQYKGDLSL